MVRSSHSTIYGTVVAFPKVYVTNTESPTLLVVYSTNHIWYGRRIPESLRNEHGKPHTVSSRFNRRTVVAFPKVYVSSTEGLAPPRGMQYG